ncbi:4930512M02Rik [Phodopus roborovskii]|uniref:4930512M02Rik protein n=1 Tax=Phodopus roborovskii TaxID=109678 RepID=A0AAU9YWU9_PHORO|nr:4930512M02Rik [Phodopus roborovskii]
MLASVVPDLLPSFSISSIPLVCVAFIFSVSVFKSWTVSLTCLIVFSWFSVLSLSNLLISSNILFVFSSISSRDCLTSSLRASIIFMMIIFKSFTSASSTLGCSGLVGVDSLDSGGRYNVCISGWSKISSRSLHRQGPSDGCQRSGFQILINWYPEGSQGRNLSRKHGEMTLPTLSTGSCPVSCFIQPKP